MDVVKEVSVRNKKGTISDRGKRPDPRLTPQAPRRETGLAQPPTSVITPHDSVLARFPIGRSATLRIWGCLDALTTTTVDSSIILREIKGGSGNAL